MSIVPLGRIRIQDKEFSIFNSSEWVEKFGIDSKNHELLIKFNMMVKEFNKIVYPGNKKKRKRSHRS